MACGIIAWCDTPENNNSLLINVSNLMLRYNGNVKLEQLSLKADDKEEIIALYQEIGDNTKYKDSLLIAERYTQWLWINAFAQSNLDTLYDYNLTIENLQKTQIIINDKSQSRKAVLVEYDITSWFIKSIPVLYMSQLFIENGPSVILISYTSEDSQARAYMSNVLKNIK